MPRRQIVPDDTPPSIEAQIEACDRGTVHDEFGYVDIRLTNMLRAAAATLRELQRTISGVCEI
jgi:hypothetical protein